MSDLLNKSLNEDDRNQALDSLRLLIKGIPIYDDQNILIGFIEKPDMNAIKFVIGATNNIEKEPTVTNSNQQTVKHKNISGKH